MKKKKSLLLITLIVSFVLIVSAVIVSLTAGIKLGTDVAGGYQIEVAYQDQENIDAKVEKVKAVLTNNGVNVETVFIEDKNTDTVIVVRTATKNIDKEAIVEKLVQELSVDESNIYGPVELSGTITKKAVLWTSITLVCLLIALFVACWIRYNVMSGLTMLFVVLHTLLLNIAVLILTRLPLNIATIITIVCTTILVLFAFIMLLERIKENMSQKHNEDLSIEEVVNLSERGIAIPLIFVASAVFIVSLIMLFVPVSYVTYLACALLVGLVVAAYTYCLVGVDVHKRLLEVKAVNDKARLSKNSTEVAKPKRPKSRKTR